LFSHSIQQGKRKHNKNLKSKTGAKYENACRGNYETFNSIDTCVLTNVCNTEYKQDHYVNYHCYQNYFSNLIEE